MSEPHRQCEICGRFCRRVRDEFSGDYWRCGQAYYDSADGTWEHR